MVWRVVTEAGITVLERYGRVFCKGIPPSCRPLWRFVLVSEVSKGFRWWIHRLIVVPMWINKAESRWWWWLARTKPQLVDVSFERNNAELQEVDIKIADMILRQHDDFIAKLPARQKSRQKIVERTGIWTMQEAASLSRTETILLFGYVRPTDMTDWSVPVCIVYRPTLAVKTRRSWR